jgi:hypothetical protein
MRVVHVRVSQTDFAEIFEAMATWLDRNNRPTEHFGTEAGDGDGIVHQGAIRRRRPGRTIPARVPRKLRRLTEKPKPSIVLSTGEAAVH